MALSGHRLKLRHAHGISFLWRILGAVVSFHGGCIELAFLHADRMPRHQDELYVLDAAHHACMPGGNVNDHAAHDAVTRAAAQYALPKEHAPSAHQQAVLLK